MKRLLRFSLLALALSPGLAGANEAADTAATETAKSEAAAKAAVDQLNFSGIKLRNAKEAGAPAAYVEAFRSELSKRLAEKPLTGAAAGGTVEVRFDKVSIQGDVVRGKEGDPIPRDLFAATVRVFDDKGEELSIYVIPETQLRGDNLRLDTQKLLGVEGAAIVYRRMFGTF